MFKADKETEKSVTDLNAEDVISCPVLAMLLVSKMAMWS